MKIPVIDIFAGPGGLGEGFSSVIEQNQRIFEIKLSIEKDPKAFQTLKLRSFFRKFPLGEVPDEYYQMLREKKPELRDEKISELYINFPRQAQEAAEETWCAALGDEENFPSTHVDSRIEKALNGRKDWLLIGGPPCQAYSMAGRSRVGGIDHTDHRVYLYKQYLRIIARHQPAVFVMENVKGLLSAKVNEEKVFDWIKKDLSNPASVFSEVETAKYRIYSLSSKLQGHDEQGNPLYKDDRDFLIKAEDYNVPQKRHRVILLGIREDIDLTPEILDATPRSINLKEVIGDLPPIRSGLGRKILSSEVVSGKIKRKYQNIADSDEVWEDIIQGLRKEILTWNGFKSHKLKEINSPSTGIGGEFVKCSTPSQENPLKFWYEDKNLNGVSNHQSRAHLIEDLNRYLFSSMFAEKYGRFPRLHEFEHHNEELMPDHKSANSGKFADRFRVQMAEEPATTVTSHISKDGHYFIHYDSTQCRSLTVREAARIQTFPDNYLFCGSRTAQYHQVGNAVPPFLAWQIGKIVKKIFHQICLRKP